MNRLQPIFALALLVIILYSCGDNENAQQQARAAQQQAQPYPVISVATKTVTSYTNYPASIEGIINSDVRAKIGGYITDVLIDEGQKVKKGQTLFKLETQSLNQDASAAKATVNAAQVEVDKLKPLVEKKIISEVQLETAKAQLQQAKSSYSSIAANIDYANIKSPVDGYVGSIRLRKGALISPSDQEPLTTVADISNVYAYFSLNEKEYLDFIQNAEGETLEEKIKKLPEVRLLLANGELYEHLGKIETINSQIDRQTGAVSFRAIFPNPGRLLTNGNSGKVQIPETFENAVVIPQESTFERQGSVLAMKVVDSNKVDAAVITILTQVENLYVVGDGVKDGDLIVAKGVSKLKDGTKIKPNEVPFDSIAKPTEIMFQ